MLRTKILKMLKRSPVLYSAVQGAYRERKLREEPVQTPFGFRLLGLDAMQDGTFEPVETERVQALLNDVDVFVNIGANVGYYVCHALKAKKHVVAVEPLAQNFALLVKNLEVNGWDEIELFPVASGDRSTVTRIYGGGTAASLIEGWAKSVSSHYTRVPVLTLDTILGDRFADKRMLIMIDVEGFELPVLQGALKQLQRDSPPVWFIEIGISEHMPDGVTINPNLLPTFDLLWEYGYRAESVAAPGNAISRAEVEAWSNGQESPELNNFIFMRD